MNILILEENMAQAQSLERNLRRSMEPLHACLCRSPEQAVGSLEAGCFDLFIVDAACDPAMELAGRIRSVPRYKMTWLIFLAADTAFEYRAFNEFHCYYYFIRPFDLADLAGRIQALARYEIVEIVEDKHLVLSHGGTVRKIRAQSISYIEINRRALHIVTDGGTYILNRVSISGMLGRLPPDMFVQCHRSFLVNRNLVKSVDIANSRLSLDSTDRILPIGGRFRQNLLNILI